MAFKAEGKIRKDVKVKDNNANNTNVIPNLFRNLNTVIDLSTCRLIDFKKKLAFTLAESATHVDLSPTKVKFAFTLAEVLITLGIIGIVAAMTIPNLITKHQQKVTVTKLEKAISYINQACRLEN